MASAFHIQEPCTVAPLPPKPTYEVGEVVYESTISRKRKRSSEVVVGIDGVAAEIHDVRPIEPVSSSVPLGSC